ncbi:MAG: TatD family hydrolase [Kiritimatiellae bacterium]|nr:TatD family hydrolase [Kiritimatiellia bacterium]
MPLRENLSADPHAGVGEIGLDRLKEKTISPAQRAAFAAQLEVAAEFARPVVLHGAKCWGEVVAACRPYAGRIPAFLFHGFSRSGGLLPDIAALNGFVGVGAALLNDHAVNYRELVREVPIERVLVETDADYGRAGARPSPCGSLGRAGARPSPEEIVCKLAELRGVEPAALEAAVDANAARFVEALA